MVTKLSRSFLNYCTYIITVLIDIFSHMVTNMNSSVVEDFYQPAFEGLALKILYAAALIITCVTGLVLCCGLIYYESSICDRYRTLVNKLYAQLMALFVFALFPLYILSIIRIWIGPFNCLLSHCISMLITVVMVNICLIISESCLIQYVYCCYSMGVGLINEDFFILYFKTGRYFERR